MRIEPRLAEDVRDRFPARDEGVGDELTVAAPRNRLGAQHGRGPRAADLEQPRQGSLKRRRLHMVGVPAERGAPPRGIDGVRPGDTTPAQVGGVLVADSGGGERGRQGVPGELRVAARRGIPADIDDVRNPVGREQPEEVRPRPGRVPDGIDHRGKETRGVVARKACLTRIGPARYT